MDTSIRRDRLLNALHRGSTTVPALAAELGVSERTAYRDIAALRRAGHDIQATPGPGGGVAIAPDSRPRAVHFEVDEIIGLALSVAILESTPHMPFAPSARAALDRARRALSSERQRAMRRLEKRILVAESASEQTRGTLGPVDETLLVAFERCFTEGMALTFDYTRPQGEPSARRAECVALMLRAPAWYVVAWDLDKDAPRVFRMDRIARPAPGERLSERHRLDQVIEASTGDDPEPRDHWAGRLLG